MGSLEVAHQKGRYLVRFLATPRSFLESSLSSKEIRAHHLRCIHRRLHKPCQLVMPFQSPEYRHGRISVVLGIFADCSLGIAMARSKLNSTNHRSHLEGKGKVRHDRFEGIEYLCQIRPNRICSFLNFYRSVPCLYSLGIINTCSALVENKCVIGWLSRVSLTILRRSWQEVLEKIGCIAQEVSRTF